MSKKFDSAIHINRAVEVLIIVGCMFLVALYAVPRAHAAGWIFSHGALVPIPDAGPRVIHVPKYFMDIPADVAQDEKWAAFCKPVGVVDRYGVTYLHYAHPGCEYGRDH